MAQIRLEPLAAIHRWLAHPKSTAVGGRGTMPPVELYLEKGQEIQYKGQPCWLIKFRDYDSCERVRELQGRHIVVPASHRPLLPHGEGADEFYSDDLVGLEVWLQEEEREESESIGRVEDVYSCAGTRLGCGGGIDSMLVRKRQYVYFVEVVSYRASQGSTRFAAPHYGGSRWPRPAQRPPVGWKAVDLSPPICQSHCSSSGYRRWSPRH